MIQKEKVEQLYATSADGTEIPYFQVSNVGMEANSNNPTLLYGYGGFHVNASYLGSFARQWLDEGGVYVIAAEVVVNLDLSGISQL